MFADGFFNAPWWQGVAGIAQIIAAVFAIVTIIQARKTIRQAEEERRLSAAPEWDAIEVWAGGGGQGFALELFLVNTGLGPARNCRVVFQPSKPFELTDLVWHSSPDPAAERGWTELMKRGKIVLPGDRLVVALSWETVKSFTGLLSIECTTRFGDKARHDFRVSVDMDEDDVVGYDAEPVAD